MIGRAAFHSPWMLATVDADSRIFCDDAAAISHFAAAGVAKPLTRRQVVMQYVEYAEGAWDRGRLQLEEDLRQEMCAEGIAAHSFHTVAHRWITPRCVNTFMQLCTTASRGGFTAFARPIRSPFTDHSQPMHGSFAAHSAADPASRRR